MTYRHPTAHRVSTPEMVAAGLGFGVGLGLALADATQPHVTYVQPASTVFVAPPPLVMPQPPMMAPMMMPQPMMTPMMPMPMAQPAPPAMYPNQYAPASVYPNPPVVHQQQNVYQSPPTATTVFTAPGHATTFIQPGTVAQQHSSNMTYVVPR
eukprot:TRINITY_DN3094_c0_g1_i1.p3 TRINITY_DN3094_c0_g1~~TRINITY_DN3094_c0_g1_i1.p3  ORF type:complete len:153 (-),score=54.88 TRINITY_DN3094_c0_g1_i1:299-757(-)